MSSLYKSKRVEDKKVLEEIRQQSCMICGSRPVDPHHIDSVGSGGPDTFDNLAPLCRKHHKMVHDIGRETFVRKYPHLLLTGKRWKKT